ncbi:MAG TPA: sigma-70 family RNA polymerase sigma factor [Pyrinomonadaceae bacterium]|nr:sigma-70 family RNA polymerase sigma factor [Pyrinomonadaceae bacterium]
MIPGQEGQNNVTELLREWTEGRTAAMDELLPYIYNDLHRRAAAYLRRERINHTLQPTALVHEAYLRLVDQQRVEWKSRGHFFAVAAQAMRRILVDHAKHRNREKRGGAFEDMRIDGGFDLAATEKGIDIEALDEALSRLAAVDPEQERLVELRYFAGLSLEDAAAAMNVSRATAAREWQVAKAWLFRELTR